jgi:hypothetical protein
MRRKVTRIGKWLGTGDMTYRHKMSLLWHRNRNVALNLNSQDEKAACKPIELMGYCCFGGGGGGGSDDDDDDDDDGSHLGSSGSSVGGGCTDNSSLKHRRDD